MAPEKLYIAEYFRFRLRQLHFLKDNKSMKLHATVNYYILIPVEIVKQFTAV